MKRTEIIKELQALEGGNTSWQNCNKLILALFGVRGRFFGLLASEKPKMLHIGNEEWKPLCGAKNELHCEGEIDCDSQGIYWIEDNTYVGMNNICKRCVQKYDL